MLLMPVFVVVVQLARWPGAPVGHGAALGRRSRRSASRAGIDEDDRRQRGKALAE